MTTRTADLRLSKLDKKVIDAFIDKKPADSRKMETDGKTLDIAGMGGKGVAKWSGSKIDLVDLGSRSGQTVHNYIRKQAPANWLKGASMNPEANLRKSLIRTAATLPKGSQERKALLGLLGAPQQKVAGLPRATKRPPGRKFREAVQDWMRRDIQTKLEAGGMPQNNINDFTKYLPDIMTSTTYSGGIGGENFQHFPTQQDAVDWLAGKTRIKHVSQGLGKERYPDILVEAIAKYGGGNDAVRDKARAAFNKLKTHQKAIAAAVMGLPAFDPISLRRASDWGKGIDRLEQVVDESSGDVLAQVIPILAWATKVPMWPAAVQW